MQKEVVKAPGKAEEEKVGGRAPWLPSSTSRAPRKAAVVKERSACTCAMAAAPDFDKPTR